MVGAQGAMSFEDWLAQQRELTVRHLVRLRSVDVAYARYALSALEAMPDCPFPKIRADVQAAWAARERAKEHGGSDADSPQ